MATKFQGAVSCEFGGHDIAWIVVRTEQGLVKGVGMWRLLRLAHGDDLQEMCCWGQKKRPHYFCQDIEKHAPDAGNEKVSSYLLLTIPVSYIDNA